MASTNLFNRFSAADSGLRANWNAVSVTTYLEFLLDEKNRGNWAAKSPSSRGYENIMKKFENEGTVFYTRKQLKSKFESLRNLFSLWTQMFNGQTGGGYDIATGRLVMDEEWWATKINHNENYRKFRDEGLANADLMFNIFGDGNATGEYQFTPTAANSQYRPHFSRLARNTQNNEFSPPEVDSPNLMEASTSRLSGGKRKTPENPSGYNPLDYTITLNDTSDTSKEASDILKAMRPHISEKLFKLGLINLVDMDFRNLFVAMDDFNDRVFMLESKDPQFKL